MDDAKTNFTGKPFRSFQASRYEIKAQVTVVDKPILKHAEIIGHNSVLRKMKLSFEPNYAEYTNNWM